MPCHDVHPLPWRESSGHETCRLPFRRTQFPKTGIREQNTFYPHRIGAQWCKPEQMELIMGAKIRFSVSLSDETNNALEALAADHKPPLSKSYLVEYAVLRLLSAIKSRQLALPLVLEDEDSAR